MTEPNTPNQSAIDDGLLAPEMPEANPWSDPPSHEIGIGHALHPETDLDQIPDGVLARSLMWAYRTHRPNALLRLANALAPRMRAVPHLEFMARMRVY